jgi:hypothetical protein
MSTFKDPDDVGPKNSDRAECAQNALTTVCNDTGVDQEVERNEAVSDLIANLGHYCDEHGLNFLALSASAIAVWDAEKREEANNETNALYPERKVSISFAQ